MQRSRYVNSYRTFRQLLQLGVIPVVNENDTVAVDELKYGDYDTLSAQVASLVGADWLFLLTDVQQLYSADPRHNADAEPIYIVDRVEQLNALKVNVGDRGSQWGTGGMMTKIEAARIATTAGVRTVITEGKHPENLIKILSGETLGTQFSPQPRPANARKRWIAHGLVPAGKLYLDNGAVRAICQGGRSLLAAGITEVEGEFERQDAVQLYGPDGQEVGRGLVNYGRTELQQIQGHHSEEIAQILGYDGAETVIHRDNLVVQAP
ncbi:MAG: glutamate 5-kinase [Leptolyngbyaceae cyanobacterium]